MDVVVPLLKEVHCPKCKSEAPIQVDLIETKYRVLGQRRTTIYLGWRDRQVDQKAIHASFMRCEGCGAEWPIPEGTRFKFDG